MSKRKKQHKLDQKALEDARKITFPKILRLLLKSMLFSLVVLGIMLLLNALGLPALQSMWVQVIVMIVVYVVAYPFLISEFRPRRSGEKH